MIIKSVKTYVCEIFLAGEIADIERECAAYCMTGLCVSVERVKYIYTGGREDGAVVRLLNYPRFPATPEEIFTLARTLADKLMIACNQHSVLLVTAGETEWRTRRPENK